MKFPLMLLSIVYELMIYYVVSFYRDFQQLEDFEASSYQISFNLYI